ncbi:hypothetical protein CEXT_228871 [Caerostris extrusa]|uniref:Uncharacterized protein n=1 Tax=Caerostris extrusa TaxID=172846 RepID=A0AAV4NPZ5_CAEEX|nr:hypothetical protein CEXT_228871 [Caerostris extrusa]
MNINRLVQKVRLSIRNTTSKCGAVACKDPPGRQYTSIFTYRWAVRGVSGTWSQQMFNNNNNNKGLSSLLAFQKNYCRVSI